MIQRPSHVYELLIKTTPEKLWQAITDGEYTKDYYFGGRIESSWKEGERYQFRAPNGDVNLFGKILEFDPNHKLVTTFEAAWDQLPEGTDPSVVSWLIEPTDGLSKLTFTHEGYDPATFEEIHSGWILILSGLKTLLETGKPLSE